MLYQQVSCLQMKSVLVILLNSLTEYTVSWFDRSFCLWWFFFHITLRFLAFLYKISCIFLRTRQMVYTLMFNLLLSHESCHFSIHSLEPWIYAERSSLGESCFEWWQNKYLLWLPYMPFHFLFIQTWLGIHHRLQTCQQMADKAAQEGICSVITPTNKLFSIKPVLGKNKPHTSLCRRDETVITRLRIGHSRVTHSYLMSRESQPVCDHCKRHLTVKHMLLECPSTAVICHKYFSSATLKELFSNVDARCILDFAKESGFYRAILITF